MRNPTFRKWADWLCNTVCLLIFLLAVLGTFLGWLP